MTMPPFLARLLRPFTTSTSLGLATPSSIPISVPEGSQRATFAAGCFWGVEHMFRREFKDKGMYDARVGYSGGNMQNPGYRDVCRGNTGHAESLQITYNPSVLPYRTLVEFFYRMHDPTTPERQGPDVGNEYRSAIFYHDAEQERIARDVTQRVNEKWWSGRVATELLEAGDWWDAEAYHQEYLTKNRGGYECPSHFLRKLPSLD